MAIPFHHIDPRGSGVSAWRLRVLLAVLGASCGEPGRIDIDIYKKDVAADDGFALSAFDLHLRGHPRDEVPAVWMFYLVGSEPVSVMQSTAQFADLVARGFCVVLLQPRGVAVDGTVDQDVFRRHETRQRRVADEIAVMDAYLTGSSSTPVLLVGSSQGGVVAADIAAADPRVTHLFMMASGGGWTQAEELEFFVEKEPGTLGMSSTAELRAKFDEIRAAPDSGELWAGHPFRMWSSYLWFRPLDGLAPLSIPMFLAQGTADRAVPVESARALRDELARLGRCNLTYVEYPGLDHHFEDAAGESRMVELQDDAYAWMAGTGLVGGLTD
jgi:pimeloyl-ACP methyl ester carboxylesterase